MQRELAWVDPATLEPAWRLLPGGPDAYNAAYGESWQYMGTVREGPSLEHQFRHRAHPDYANQRVYVYMPDGDMGPRVREIRVRV